MNDIDIRTLMRRSRAAALATAMQSDAGWAYASLVTVASDLDASPILLLSDLSDHTRNLAHDPRASLLFDGTCGFANPQEGPRVSLLGQIEIVDRADLRDRFLARHPAAALYADFADFHFYRMHVARAHVVGGFARAAWLSSDRFLLNSERCHAFFNEGKEAVSALNEAFSAEVNRIANDRNDAGELWSAVALDPDGLDLIRSGMAGRIDFPEPVDTPTDAIDMIRSIIPPQH